MTTLLQRCQNLKAKLNDLSRAKLLAEDSQHIQERTGEWDERNSKLRKIENQTQSLVLSAEDSTSVASKRASLRQNAGKVLERLKEKEDIKEVARDAAWKRLLKASEALTESLEAAGRNAWRDHLEKEGTLEDPALLRLRTPYSPQNDEALRAYQSSHASYAAIAKLPLPRTPEDLTQLAIYVRACLEAFKRLTFDLPSEVGAFYEAVQAGTATLAQVTPEVLKWLTERNLLGRYRVRGVTQ